MTTRGTTKATNLSKEKKGLASRIHNGDRRKIKKGKAGIEDRQGEIE